MGIEAAVVNDWRHPALHVREQDLRCIRQPEVNAIDCPVPARPLLLRHVTSTELTLVGREILCELRVLCQVHQAARTPRIHQIPIGPLHGAIANMLGHDERQQALGLDQRCVTGHIDLIRTGCHTDAHQCLAQDIFKHLEALLILGQAAELARGTLGPHRRVEPPWDPGRCPQRICARLGVIKVYLIDVARLEVLLDLHDDPITLRAAADDGDRRVGRHITFEAVGLVQPDDRVDRKVLFVNHLTKSSAVCIAHPPVSADEGELPILSEKLQTALIKRHIEICASGHRAPA